MPIETELYDLLEISPTASEGEIKRAYRKQALIHHPDKGGNEETFKKLTSAYETLSDPQKREIYDKYGKNGEATDINDIFGGIFKGGMNGIFDMYKNARNVIRKAPPVVHKYPVSLEDLCTRKVVKLRITRERPCPCIDEKTSSCVDCSGRGFTVQMRQLGPNMIQQLQSACNKCQGKGKIFPSCDKCESGVRKLPKTFQLHLTPEMENGYKYLFNGEGNQDHGQEIGDFLVIIVYNPHPVYQIDPRNKNLVCTLIITLKEALCGFTKSITHPDGSTILVIESRVVTPKSYQELEGKGLTPTGKLRVNYDIEFPQELSNNQKGILASVLF